MKTIGIIPARYHSTRFPGKMLEDLGGLPLVVRTAQRAEKADCLDEIWVATDDDRIEAAVKQAGFSCLRTRDDHPSGTDRIAEAVQSLDADVVVNVQGDEPFVSPETLQRLATRMAEADAPAMATAMTPIHSESELFDLSVVKVVCNVEGCALYFSRAAIPHARDGSPGSLMQQGLYFRHLGLYAYRRSFLEAWTTLRPHPLEETEKLEQLRALANGFSIAVIETKETAPGIDTPQDLRAARALWESSISGEMI
jgi:3-deoxy-manno-octulosonate cytidylyltransferase (CMP-KDO synthetase)